ncbi:hypothetical protein H5410_033068 [Solanum commersonii]|uniref:TIR domain-containing protein n=1 Tax=Solanum commersonii TaxID=4109 RepID=A0A9J5YMM1_SOLCO|nr:hypothetical protein H5410_033068 [Solanum commersonii]
MASQFRSVKKWKYGVFLNFLWEDFNGNFVTDLYKRLEDKGINAFKDDGKSAKKAPISTEISEAIEESRIAITIFSGVYAFSRRCLAEITKIMECVDSHGQEFFPVFYWIQPSVVSRTFDLKKNKEYFNCAYSKRFQRYKDALSKAFAGFNEDRYDPFELICW